jgi:hypothetical protein
MSKQLATVIMAGYNDSTVSVFPDAVLTRTCALVGQFWSFNAPHAIADF